MTCHLAGSLFMYAARWLTLPTMAVPVECEPEKGLRVAVVTTFVPGAEPIELLEETLRSLVALDYEHTTWVLDEGDAPEVRALCAEVGARHFTRKSMKKYQAKHGRFRSLSKHGNYNAWLCEIGFDNYDVVAAFDPDHIVRRDYLVRTLGYLRDATIGYVRGRSSM